MPCYDREFIDKCRGDKGDRGLPGPRGDRGAPGLTGNDGQSIYVRFSPDNSLWHDPPNVSTDRYIVTKVGDGPWGEPIQLSTEGTSIISQDTKKINELERRLDKMTEDLKGVLISSQVPLSISIPAIMVNIYTYFWDREVEVDYTARSVQVHGNYTRVLWDKMEGGEARIVNEDTLFPTFHLKEGNYKFRITASDDQGYSVSEILNIDVHSETDEELTLIDQKTHYAYLSGESSTRYTPEDISPRAEDAEVFWEKTEGSEGVIITGGDTYHPVISNLKKGAYEFKATISQPDTIHMMTYKIEVKDYAPPIISEIQVPYAHEKATGRPDYWYWSLKCIVTDPDTEIRNLKFQWEQVSGPFELQTFKESYNKTKQTCIWYVLKSQPGTYTVRCTVTDDHQNSAMKDYTFEYAT